jgi:tRNA nucleotidyltransferase (CCA-adding enzyme)
MNLKQVFLKQLDLIKPTKSDYEQINNISKIFIQGLEERLKKRRISAEVFVGGSLAKKTLVKKDKYDIDIFVRFDEKYNSDEISNLLETVIGKSAKRIHGSRDYFHLIIQGIILEVVPVIKIKKPEQAQNVTDLSYFHVRYILDKLKKNKKLADEIMLAKSFIHAQKCYGAESYIHGFSGYSLELLICHYKSLENFLKEIIKKRKDKLIIDDAKFYNKTNVLTELNESKLQSPIILIDPTFKQRNALAGLSYETFNRLNETIRKFLKKPSTDFFREKDISADLIKRQGNKLNIVSVITKKQTGDIAGTKSKRFFEFFLHRIKREFLIKHADFEYQEQKNIAYFYLVLDKKSSELIQGPKIEDKKNVARFKKVHKKTIIKNRVIYTEIEHKFNFNEFLKRFIQKEKKVIEEMSIKKIELVR